MVQHFAERHVATNGDPLQSDEAPATGRRQRPAIHLHQVDRVTLEGVRLDHLQHALILRIRPAFKPFEAAKVGGVKLNRSAGWRHSATATRLTGASTVLRSGWPRCRPVTPAHIQR